MMEASDYEAWGWTTGNVSGFTMEAGLIPGMIADMKMGPDEKRIFIKKVGMIYETLLKIERENEEAKRDQIDVRYQH